jgi:hypothetical protein
MKYLLISLLVSANGFVSAQHYQNSQKEPLSEHYAGISTGFSGAVRPIYFDTDRANGLVTEFSFGKRLVRSLYAEVGLAHIYNVVNLRHTYGYFSSTYAEFTHAFLLPIGLRYRSNGNRFSVTGSAHFIAGQLAEILIINSEAYHDNTLLNSRNTKDVSLLTNSSQLRASLGLEYQLQHLWRLRLESQVFVGTNQLLNYTWYRQSLNLGIYKAF